MSLPGAGAADQYDGALVGEEVAAGEVTHQALVDWRAREVELLDLLGQLPRWYFRRPAACARVMGKE
jgi:hypothetical protein